MNRGIIGLFAGGIVLAGLGAVAIGPRLQQRQGVALTIGGPFALTDGAGHQVTDRDFRGRWMLVYFGYTHCPDACPTTLSDIGAGLDKLTPDERKRLAVVFITVDPARDTPAVIGAYARAFGSEFVGLTGSAAELAPVERAFRVYAQRHDLKGGDYAMDHSSIIYVIGPDGRFLGLLDDQLAPAEIAKRLRGMGA